MSIIDLSLLAPPAVVEALSYESILAALQTDVLARQPELAEALALESEPINIVLQACAYRELLLRQRVNEAARAVMLAYATGTDLDQIGGNYGIPRLTITPANPLAVPPVAAVLETDTAYRQRILLSLDSYTTAGSAASYRFHALSASGQVLAASATSSTPGTVTVHILSTVGNGTASPELLATVATALNAEHVRPLNDLVEVLSATIAPYTITANLVLLPGPDSEAVRQAALTAAQAYAQSARALGNGVSLSGIYAALHQPGVKRVELAAPLADIPGTVGTSAYCTAITLTTST